MQGYAWAIEIVLRKVILNFNVWDNLFFILLLFWINSGQQQYKKISQNDSQVRIVYVTSVSHTENLDQIRKEVFMKPEEMKEGILTRNPQTYEYLMTCYSRLLWTIAAGILNGVGTREDVEDVISDVFLSLWEHPQQFDETRGSIKTWLCVKTRSRAIDLLRKNCRESFSAEKLSGGDSGQIRELRAEEDPILDQILLRQQAAEVVRQIQALEPPNREILMLRLVYEVKPTLIAAKLKLPVEEIYDRIRIGKRKLKRKLKADLEGTK